MGSDNFGYENRLKTFLYRRYKMLVVSVWWFTDKSDGAAKSAALEVIDWFVSWGAGRHTVQRTGSVLCFESKLTRKTLHDRPAPFLGCSV